MDWHETRPFHFIYPFLLLIAGGAVGTYWIWWLGICIVVLAGLMTLWLAIHSILDRTTALIEASTEHYRTIHDLTDEEKVEVGMTIVPDQVRVERTDGRLNWTYDFLPVSPVKLKVIAKACLNGRPFSEREWMGRDKILTDTEFYPLRDALLKDDVYMKSRNPNEPRQGFEWTEAGVKLLEGILHASYSE